MAADALWIIAVWVLSGIGFGLLSTTYGAFRSQWRVLPGIRDALDWMFFVVLGMLYVVVLFWTDWGMFRVWSILAILLGYGLWTWLAAPPVLKVLSFVIHWEARGVYFLTFPFSKAQKTLRKKIRIWISAKNPPPNE